MRILVADDIREVREVIAAILEDAGFEVDQVSDGAEVLQAFSVQPPDLLVCDLFMPSKDGLETIQEVRREHPNVKIIAISGDSAARDMLTVARLIGAAEVLSKPIDVTRLLTAVRRVLRINE